jgi:hypothetical protein
MPSSLNADYIFHADGSIIEARIISQTATSATIRLKNGLTRTIKGSDILRIREKPVIKKNIRIFDLGNGKTLESNLVDESPLSYAFRNNMAKPEEFRIKRENLLFLDSPLALTPVVIPGSRDATVQWDLQESISHYNLYIKEGNGKLSKIYDGEKTETTIYTLKGNTSYALTLFALDNGGHIFGPAKEVEFVTLNNPPSVPQNLSCTELFGDSPSLLLSWNPSLDEDGAVVKYKIHMREGESHVHVGTNEKCEWMVFDYDRSMLSSFAVSAVDDKNAESPMSVFVQSRAPFVYGLRFEPAYYYTLGSLSNTFTYGYGGTVSGEKRNFIINNLGLGVGTGFISFKGKGRNQGDLFPLFISTRYTYSFSDPLSISGGMSIGPAYYGGKISGRSFSRTAAIGQATLGVRALIGRSFECELGAFTGSFYESRSFRYFVGGSLSATALAEF